MALIALRRILSLRIDIASLSSLEPATVHEPFLGCIDLAEACLNHQSLDVDGLNFARALIGSYTDASQPGV